MEERELRLPGTFWSPTGSALWPPFHETICSPVRVDGLRSAGDVLSNCFGSNFVG